MINEDKLSATLKRLNDRITALENVNKRKEEWARRQEKVLQDVENSMSWEEMNGRD